ncbi:MAG: molecular chaperone DnaJ, partial [Gemmatimonadetes bacterium]|nr:molecular chaperone DnaJ [Gemmatimonadota bacterium]
MNINYRPIDRWPGEQTRDRKASPFQASFPATLDLLDRELDYLGAKDVVFQVALREEDFKRDGDPRANARASHPGVILAFNSKYGPLKYATDTFSDYQANIRAIALGLEALRKVDRYGITKRGEQYTGWKALPSGSEVGAAMTVDEAALHLATWGSANLNTPIDPEELIGSAMLVAGAYRMAAKRMHPDAGGSTDEFQRLQEAKRV